MPAFLIRNIPKKTHEEIKRRAKRNGNSTEAELRLIVAEAARAEAKPEVATAQKPAVGIGTMLQEIARKHGVSFPDFVRDKTPIEPMTFD